MAGVMRVRAPAGSIRRAGFRFDAEPTPLVSDEVTPSEVLAMARDPRLVVEVEVDGEYVLLSGDLQKLAALDALAIATEGLSPGQIAGAMVNDDVRQLMHDAFTAFSASPAPGGEIIPNPGGPAASTGAGQASEGGTLAQPSGEAAGTESQTAGGSGDSAGGEPDTGKEETATDPAPEADADTASKPTKPARKQSQPKSDD
ncbi:hypothetical protein [Sphingomonas paucimobilis]|uniref:Mu-like prophage FluMu N-terminal domain-containing protein n=1 Tax=Sphingomonas paucimobilis TaxID=13689 RepID=A0A7T3A9C1_SPHPI|nr:hypothetical protein [Sphingomonas paucimobilis]QPT08588.1 hypothetical protein I6G38_18025 [Sphingomonas paucimobilis]